MFKVAACYLFNQDFANFRRLKFTKLEEICRFLKLIVYYIFFVFKQTSKVVCSYLIKDIPNSRKAGSAIEHFHQDASNSPNV